MTNAQKWICHHISPSMCGFTPEQNDTSSTCSPHFSTFLGVAKAAKALTHRGPKESHPHSRAGEHLNDHLLRSSAVPMDPNGFDWISLGMLLDLVDLYNFGELGFMEDISDIYSCWWGYKQTNLRRPHSYKCKSWWIQHDITTVGPWINHDQLVCWTHFCWENI